MPFVPPRPHVVGDLIVHQPSGVTMEVLADGVVCPVSGDTPAPVTLIDNIGDQVLPEGAPGSIDFSQCFTGAPVITYSLSPAAPAGMVFDPATGVLSGTPTTSGAPVTYTISAVNPFGPAVSKDINIEVTSSGVPVTLIDDIGPQSFAEGDVVNLDFTTCFAGDPTISYSLVGVPGIPASLSFSPTTGVLSGTIDAGEQGAYNLTVTADNPFGPAVSKPVAFDVTCEAPSIIGSIPGQTNSVNALVNEDLATGFFAGDNLTFSATNLPAGLTIDPATGIVSGIPTTQNEPLGQNVTITASSPCGPDVSLTFNWLVDELQSAVSINVGRAAEFSANQAFLNVMQTARGPSFDGGVENFVFEPAPPGPLRERFIAGQGNPLVNSTFTQNANGFPTSIPAGATNWSAQVLFRDWGPEFKGTTYRLQHDGSAAINVTAGGNTVVGPVSVGGGISEYTITIPAGYVGSVIFRTAATDMTLLTMVRSDQVALFDAGDRFRPEYLDFLAPVDVASLDRTPKFYWHRYMFNARTNGEFGNNSLWPGIPKRSYSEWTPDSNFTFGIAQNEWSIEAMVELSNLTKTNLFVSLPIGLSLADYQQISQLILNTLDPSLLCRLQIGNETWNAGALFGVTAIQLVADIAFGAGWLTDAGVTGVFTHGGTTITLSGPPTTPMPNFGTIYVELPNGEVRGVKYSSVTGNTVNLFVSGWQYENGASVGNVQFHAAGEEIPLKMSALAVKLTECIPALRFNWTGSDAARLQTPLEGHSKGIGPFTILQMLNAPRWAAANTPIPFVDPKTNPDFIWPGNGKKLLLVSNYYANARVGSEQFDDPVFVTDLVNQINISPAAANAWFLQQMLLLPSTNNGTLEASNIGFADSRGNLPDDFEFVLYEGSQHHFDNSTEAISNTTSDADELLIRQWYVDHWQTSPEMVQAEMLNFDIVRRYVSDAYMFFEDISNLQTSVLGTFVAREGFRIRPSHVGPYRDAACDMMNAIGPWWRPGDDPQLLSIHGPISFNATAGTTSNFGIFGWHSWICAADRSYNLVGFPAGFSVIGFDLQVASTVAPGTYSGTLEAVKAGAANSVSCPLTVVVS